MNPMPLAIQCGILPSAIQGLLRGRIGFAVADRLGIAPGSLQRFVDGGSSVGLATRLDLSPTALQELRDQLGRDGAIGLVLGLLFQRAD